MESWSLPLLLYIHQLSVAMAISEKINMGRGRFCFDSFRGHLDPCWDGGKMEHYGEGDM